MTTYPASIASQGPRNSAFTSCNYDVFGNAIGNWAPELAATNLLYSGEWFDVETGQQYLRARYYDPVTGRWNRLDDYPGDPQSPRSLHKYTYAYSDPIQGTDPSGLDTFLADLGRAAHRLISNLYEVAHPGNLVTYGASIPGAAGQILPDIMNFSSGSIAGIKPASVGGVAG